MKKNTISLLPYIEEPLFGLSPNDPQLVGWEINKFNIQEQWRISQGEDVIVAVIDTGCDFNHADLRNNVIKGMNFVEKGADPMDRNGHGTHVSSTIAACNNGFGMVGVAPKAKIMPVKSLNDSGGGDLSNVVDGIMWAADNNADIITMSLGSPSSAPPLEKAINYAASKGCIIFCAAGNSGPSRDIMYPAKYNHTIAIGAIDENLERTDFTCSGDSLDFLAPGHNIMGCVPNNRYALMSGTSMSNPFAVGCATLLCSYNKKHQRYNLKTTDDYIEVFKSKSQKLNNPSYTGKRKYEGYGIMYPVL
jgi:subtilisin family serine protease